MDDTNTPAEKDERCTELEDAIRAEFTDAAIDELVYTTRPLLGVLKKDERFGGDCRVVPWLDVDGNLQRSVHFRERVCVVASLPSDVDGALASIRSAVEASADNLAARCVGWMRESSTALGVGRLDLATISAAVKLVEHTDPAVLVDAMLLSELMAEVPADRQRHTFLSASAPGIRYAALEIEIDGRWVTFLADRSVPSSTAFVTQLDAWRLGSLGRPVSLFDEDLAYDYRNDAGARDVRVGGYLKLMFNRRPHGSLRLCAPKASK
jgi:hypothetical protein